MLVIYIKHVRICAIAWTRTQMCLHWITGGVGEMDSLSCYVQLAISFTCDIYKISVTTCFAIRDAVADMLGNCCEQIPGGLPTSRVCAPASYYVYNTQSVCFVRVCRHPQTVLKGMTTWIIRFPWIIRQTSGLDTWVFKGNPVHRWNVSCDSVGFSSGVDP